MTRPEITGKRSFVFSQWIRKELPDSYTGMRVYNLDWLLWHKTKRKIVMFEEKINMGKLPADFRFLINKIIKPALREFSKKNNIDFKGYYLIQFENTCPTDGKTFINGKLISEQELKKFLSFE